MAITRTADTDDDGTGTTGTIRDNSWKTTTIYDPIDALIADRQTVAFSAGNFTASAGTWTLVSGDQISFWYQIHNKLMTVGFVLDTTSVSTTPAELRITIPGSKTCAVATFEKLAWANDNGTVREAYAAISGTTIAIRRQDGSNWTASANATYTYGRVTFPIS